ncbi:MAG TPA: hypothetical protein VIK31_11805 [Propionibacteriaceae bacterium]
MSIPKERALVLADRARRGWITRRRENTARDVRLGNTNNLRHGIYSTVYVRDDVLAEAALLYARAPWLDEIRDGIAVEATARLVVRLRKLDAVLAAADEPTMTLTSMYTRLEGQLTRNLDALGLTPTAAARLGISKLDARQRAQKLATDALEQYRPAPREVADNG